MMNEMKRIIIVLVMALACYSAIAGEHLRERVYLSTDKTVYVAGDKVWLSAFCIDVNTNALSTFSRTAYVELHSTGGMVQTAKVALESGRGGGELSLPMTLPTGNYKLLAYTAQSCNETAYDYLLGARTISVFNTLSADRVDGGVEVLDAMPAASSAAPASDGIAIKYSDGEITLVNETPSAVSLSLSIYHDDGIPSPVDPGLGKFLEGVRNLPPATFTQSRTAEYEGEIVRAHVAGVDASKIPLLEGCPAFLSVPSKDFDIYSAPVSSDGTLSFYTDNILGQKDMVLEIGGIDNDMACHLELESPFVDVSVTDIPALGISPDMTDALALRNMGMQISRAFDADTLYEYIPYRKNPILTNRCIRYILDDYTRFPLMEEVFVEFIPELRIRKSGGRRDIQVCMEDSFNTYYFAQGSSLMMMDGVPVFDQEKIIGYDPLLVKSIDIYPFTYFIGGRSFSGLVNFVTYKGNLPSMKFADNARVLSFQGASVPVAMTGEGMDAAYPDYRQTILWHPLLSLDAGQSITLKCKTPAYGGRFEIVAEGLSADCSPAGGRASIVL